MRIEVNNHVKEFSAILCKEESMPVILFCCPQNKSAIQPQQSYLVPGLGEPIHDKNSNSYVEHLKK